MVTQFSIVSRLQTRDCYTLNLKHVILVLQQLALQDCQRHSDPRSISRAPGLRRIKTGAISGSLTQPAAEFELRHS